jgi:hypothetical protein
MFLLFEQTEKYYYEASINRHFKAVIIEENNEFHAVIQNTTDLIVVWEVGVFDFFLVAIHHIQDFILKDLFKCELR